MSSINYENVRRTLDVAFTRQLTAEEYHRAAASLLAMRDAMTNLENKIAILKGENDGN